MRTLLLSVPLAALAATFFFACGDSGSGTGGAGGTTSTTTSTTKASSTSGTTSGTTTSGTMSTGTGTGMCMDDGMCDLGGTDADCTCADCVMDAQCGGCNPDMMCGGDDACTCKDCWYDGSCGSSGCMDDGVCDQYTEGCICADCASQPNCTGYTPPPAVPATWTCTADYWADGSCDCGCGAVDFDCADATKASCEFCEDMGSCDEGVMCSDAMSKIDPTNNAVCTPAP